MSTLLKQNKEIMQYWNYKKNSDIDLNLLMSQSKKKVWWICDKGHEWEAMVYTITNGNRCPYCSV